MNVEIGAEAAQFPEKEYIDGIAVAVHLPLHLLLPYHLSLLSSLQQTKIIQVVESHRTILPPRFLLLKKIVY